MPPYRAIWVLKNMTILNYYFNISASKEKVNENLEEIKLEQPSWPHTPFKTTKVRVRHKVMQADLGVDVLLYITHSLVPRPIPTFSMLHAVGIGLGIRLHYTHTI